MKLTWVAAIVLLLVSPALAVKNRHRSFTQPCDVVWKASVAVAKMQEYRIVSISKEERILSLSAGGAWSGERLISLSLEPAAEIGCVATVQSRFSGLAHSDGPDLLKRIAAQVLTGNLDQNSKPVRRFKNCMDSLASDAKCEQQLRKDLAKSKEPNASSSDHDDWWNTSK